MIHIVGTIVYILDGDQCVSGKMFRFLGTSTFLHEKMGVTCQFPMSSILEADVATTVHSYSLGNMACNCSSISQAI
jgi:hypothetical protein